MRPNKLICKQEPNTLGKGKPLTYKQFYYFDKNFLNEAFKFHLPRDYIVKIKTNDEMEID